MRNNNLLKATITVALSLMIGGTAQAALRSVGSLVVNLSAGSSSPCETGVNTTVAGALKKTTNQVLFTDGTQQAYFCLQDGLDTMGTTLNIPALIQDTNLLAGGTIFASEMFGGGTLTIPSGKDPSGGTKPAWAAVIFDTAGEGIAKVATDVKFELSDGVFDGNPRLIVSTGELANAVNLTTALPTNSLGLTTALPVGTKVNNFGEVTSSTSAIVGGGNGSKFVNIKIAPGANAELPINAATDKAELLLLLYKVKGVSALAEPTKTDNSNALTMKFSAGTDDSQGVKPVWNSSTASIARSQSALSTQIIKETQGLAEISVENGSKLFSGLRSTTGGDCQNGSGATLSDNYGVFIDDQNVLIGCVQFNSQAGTVGPDGMTPFNLTTAGGGSVDDTGTLEITAAQFAASMTSPGSVTFGSLTATTVTEDTATFNITAANLDSLINNYCGGASKCNVPIKMKVDQITSINVQEDDPTAALKLTFKNGSFNSTALSAPNEAYNNDKLRAIKENGTVCTVWNVPAADARDIINIRVTNESKAAGQLFGRLWGQDGTLLKDTFTLSDNINVKETLRFSASDIEEAAGSTWKGRAVLEIRSTLSSMEVLAMLRNKQSGNGNAPLNNISLGAHGNSCNKTVTNTPGF